MKPQLSQRFQFTLAYLLVTMVVLSFLQSWLLAPRTVELPMSQFLGLLRADKIERVAITDREIRGVAKPDALPTAPGGAGDRLRELLGSSSEVRVFTVTRIPGIDDARLVTELEAQRVGGRIPKGALLVGPPGTGKTLLARAVAGEADVPFFTLSGSEFVEMFVGVGAARVRDLFEQAKDKAPCIVFIDELDAIGKSRAGVTGFVGGHDEREQTLNQLLAARKEQDAVGMADFEEAIDRVVAGLEKKSRVLSEKERDIVAHHEMGHALVASSVVNADPVHKVTIIPRGVAALGMTYQLPTGDRFLMTRRELEDRIAVLLGGRVAEELVYGEVATGAHNDLERATEIARLMVTKYGMSERVGLATFGERTPLFLRGTGMGGERDYSEETARAIDAEVRAILDRTHDRVQGILTAKKAVLVAAAQELKRVETLDGERLRRALAGVGVNGEGVTGGVERWWS